MKIGFIGLGLMGSRMAENLIDNNYNLVVYNRTKEKAEPLVNKGAELKNTPEDVGNDVDILITMLANPDVVEKVATGENGFLKNMKENSIWIDSSTVNPSFSRKMAKAANNKKVRFIDAPVAGTIKPAKDGELIFLIGGKEKEINECEPLFNIMGKKTIHVGENGMGTSMKMVINTMLGQSMLAFSEAMTLGENLGIKKETLFNTLLGGPVTPAFLSGKKDKISEEKFEPEFPLKLMTKDLILANLSAEEKNKSFELLKTAKEVFAKAEENFGEEDFSAIYKYIKDK